MQTYIKKKLVHLQFGSKGIFYSGTPTSKWMKLDYIASQHIGMLPNGVYAVEEKMAPKGLGHLCVRLKDGMLKKFLFNAIVIIPHQAPETTEHTGGKSADTAGPEASLAPSDDDS